MLPGRDERLLRLRKYAGIAILCGLGALFALLPSFATSSAAAASFKVGSGQEYRLRLYETHRHDHIDIVYRTGNEYLPGAIRRLDYFLRDHRNGRVHAFDPRVFDLLYTLTKDVAHPGAEIQVICGYRSPQTNSFLHRTTVGVASHSLHMQGEAIDIRITGVSTARLRAAALALHDGGVGFYPQSRFVHVDVGRVRQWALLE
jgi:uncharacterized protein YcbK (DUF882 family)